MSSTICKSSPVLLEDQRPFFINLYNFFLNKGKVQDKKIILMGKVLVDKDKILMDKVTGEENYCIWKSSGG
jgi:hypothetical protein